MKCAKCQYENVATALQCNLCGELLRRRAPVAREPDTAGVKFDARATTAEGTPVLDADALAQARIARLQPPVEHPTGGAAAPPADPLGPRLVCREFATRSFGTPFVIGRVDTCNLTLASNLISRSHAVIDATSEGGYTITDQGSANGTFLNGALLDPRMPRALTSGDNISIGPYTLRFVVGEDESEWDQPIDDGGGTTQMRVVRKVDAGFAGRLSELSLVDLLQSIGLYRRSGTLRLQVGFDQGWIKIDKGQPHSASFGGSAGVEAVKRLILLEDGEFSFDAPDEGFPGGAKQIDVSMTRVLVEGQKAVERRRR